MIIWYLVLVTGDISGTHTSHFLIIVWNNAFKFYVPLQLDTGLPVHVNSFTHTLACINRRFTHRPLAHRIHYCLFTFVLHSFNFLFLSFHQVFGDVRKICARYTTVIGYVWMKTNQLIVMYTQRSIQKKGFRATAQQSNELPTYEFRHIDNRRWRSTRMYFFF